MHYTPYTLYPIGAMSARAAAQPREGVLLRGDNGGYACLQPGRSWVTPLWNMSWMPFVTAIRFVWASAPSSVLRLMVQHVPMA